MQTPTEIQSIYPQTVAAHFSDAFGDANAIVTIDGSTTTLLLRGHEFVATTEFDFDADTGEGGKCSESFQWDRFDYLANFTLSFSLTVPLVHGARQTLSQMDISVERGTLDMGTKTSLTLHWNGSEYVVTGAYCEFEILLDDLARLLPPDVYLRTCYNCLYSDYSPSGVSGFGDMTCHRNHKAAYLAVKTKWDYFALPNGERVQETYICPEWEKRIKGTGYRG